MRYQRLKKTFDALNHAVSDATIHSLAEAYITDLSSFNHLFPNTIAVLDYLKPSYKLHIITNGFQEIQDKKMRNAKIAPYFDVVVDAEMAGVKKPNPLIFEMALQKANTSPEKSIMIGDNVEADILGAQAVGFHTLHFDPHNTQQHDYCPVIDDLNKIKTYL